MPTTLPVPSKGALRALRNLALGTSCTLAVSAGILTEDRRRRIHAAREIHTNAQRIKSSRSYTAGTAAIQTFEDQILSYQDEEFWRAGNTLNRTALSKANRAIDLDGQNLESTPLQSHKSPKFSQEPAEKRQRAAKVQLRSIPARKPRNALDTRTLFPAGGPTIQLSNTPAPAATTETKSLNVDGNGEPAAAVPSESETSLFKDEAQKRQERLAHDVTKLLKEVPPNIEDATARFLGTFEEGLPVDELGLSEVLIIAAIELGRASRQHEKFDVLGKILEILVRYGPIHEEQYYELAPEEVIQILIRRTSGDTTGLVPVSNLEKAASIYLASFREKPKVMSLRMLNLGERLCRETCRSGLYLLTTLIFRHLESCRGHNQIRGVADFILATHKLGHHKKVFRIFDQLYTRTSPDQLQLWKSVNLVIDSVLRTNKPHEAETVLVRASDMAKVYELTMSTTAVLKVLGNDWRTYKDLSRTQSLFERLLSVCSITNHPQACYGAMIQFCVEANDESAAEQYYARLQLSYNVAPNDICIYGHFARAKAMRQDWTGVENDFYAMKKLAPTRHAEFSASFTPVLKIYADSHSTGEVEEFIRKFVDKFDLRLTGYMMNIMINAYSKAKETNSIARWIDYTSSTGCSVDSVFFNTILSRCYDSWKFSCQEVFDLFESVQQIDRSSRFFDEETTSILRQMALTDGRKLKRKEHSRITSLEDPEKILSPRTVRIKMASTLRTEDFVATLRTYVSALGKDIPLDAQHLHLAIKATLSLDPTDLDACTTLIQDANRRGWEIQDAIAIVLTHQGKRILSNGNESGKEFVDIAQQSILDFETRGVKVPLSILTHTMSILQRMFQFRAALVFWESTSRRLGLSAASLDLPALNVFLNIYIGLRYSAGIQWVVKTLSTNKLIPDQHFRMMLKNERRRISKLSGPASHSKDMLQYTHNVEEACRIALEIGEQSRIEKENVKFMTIKIIEKAIADQTAIERPKNDASYTVPEVFQGQAFTEGESWTEVDEESVVDSSLSASLALKAVGG